MSLYFNFPNELTQTQAISLWSTYDVNTTNYSDYSLNKNFDYNINTTINNIKEDGILYIINNAYDIGIENYDDFTIMIRVSLTYYTDSSHTKTENIISIMEKNKQYRIVNICGVNIYIMTEDKEKGYYIMEETKSKLYEDLASELKAVSFTNKTDTPFIAYDTKSPVYFTNIQNKLSDIIYVYDIPEFTENNKYTVALECWQNSGAVFEQYKCPHKTELARDVIDDSRLNPPWRSFRFI